MNRADANLVTLATRCQMETLPALAMSPLAFLDAYALPCTAMLLLTWLALRLRGRARGRGRDRLGEGAGVSRTRRDEALDTIAGWPPQATRILSRHQRQALALLTAAAPGQLVLAQVPMSRFLRVPARHSYADWLQRVGSHSADLVLCDPEGRVRMVVDICAPQPNVRKRQHQDRMARVLRAAGIPMCVWHEGALPRASAVRAEIAGLAPSGAASAAPPSASRPMPLGLASGSTGHAGDEEDPMADFAHATDPVSLDFQDDIGTQAVPARR